jgi:hypothetical protein
MKHRPDPSAQFLGHPVRLILERRKKEARRPPHWRGIEWVAGPEDPLIILWGRWDFHNILAERKGPGDQRSGGCKASATGWAAAGPTDIIVYRERN